MLSSSRNLLGTLLRSQKSDTWYLETAFYVLLSTIIWLIFRRIFYGPLWWLVWLPLKLSIRILWGILIATGLAGVRDGGEGVAVPTRESLIVQPSAKGEFPKWNTIGGKPSVVVGVGGKYVEHPIQTKAREAGSMIEEVGEIIDGGNGKQAEKEYQSQQGDARGEQEDDVDETARNLEKTWVGGDAAAVKDHIRDEL
jgi:protein transport protein SEC20